jgi:ribose/xylose/arabinose/galactoside ABC-type transport system permease subunit
VTSISTTTTETDNKQSFFNQLLWKILRTRQLFLIIIIAIIVIVLIGVLLLLITGDFDLSVGAGMALVGVCMAWTTARTNIEIGILAGLALGLFLGVLNGFLVTRLKMASFIATLGTMYMARSLCNVITQGKAIPLRNEAIVKFFNLYIFGLPITFIMLIVFVAIMAFVLGRHKYFRRLFYTGFNERGATMVGINTNKLRWSMFIFSGLMIAVGGIFYTSMLSSAVPLAFSGLEMKMIAMAVIGGTSLKGGQGSVIGCVLGLVMITLVGNAMTVIGISPNWEGAILGVILIIASILDVTLQKKGM